MNSRRSSPISQQKLSFSDMKSRLNKAKSQTLSSFKKSVESIRETQSRLSDFYASILIKLEKSFNSAKQTLIEIANFNAEYKDWVLKKASEALQSVDRYESEFSDSNNLALDKYNEALARIKEVETADSFKETVLAYQGEGSEIDKIFELVEKKKNKNSKVVWSFIDVDGGNERFFDSLVEKQLERGFENNNSSYKLYYCREKIGEANYENMDLFVYCENKKYRLLRKVVSIN